MNRLLEFLLGVIEQREHQAGAAAESAEDSSFADSGAGSDGVHRDCVRSSLGDQRHGCVQEQPAIPGGVAPFGVLVGERE